MGRTGLGKFIVAWAAFEGGKGEKENKILVAIPYMQKVKFRLEKAESRNYVYMFPGETLMLELMR